MLVKIILCYQDARYNDKNFNKSDNSKSRNIVSAYCLQ